MNAVVIALACVAIALIVAGAWASTTLIKRGQTGWGVAIFIVAALVAGLMTDNMR